MSIDMSIVILHIFMSVREGYNAGSINYKVHLPHVRL